MTELQLAPTEVEPIKVGRRHYQVAQVLGHLALGKSQVEACALVGISLRTFQRWIAKPEMDGLMARVASETLKSISLQAMAGLHAAVEFQVEVAAGRKGDPRDANKSAVFLRDLVKGISDIPAKPGIQEHEDETGTVTAKWTPRFAGGPKQSVEIKITTEGGEQVIPGDYKVIES